MSLITPTEKNVTPKNSCPSKTVAQLSRLTTKTSSFSLNEKKFISDPEVTNCYL